MTLIKDCVVFTRIKYLEMNIHFIEWYIDQTIAYIALIISITLCIITLKRINYNSTNKYPKTLKIIIYCVFIQSVLFPILSILEDGLYVYQLIPTTSNQHKICNIMFIVGTVSLSVLQVAIMNLFIERLHITFQNTSFQISNCTNYGLRVIHIILWITIDIVTLTDQDNLPYNIYKNQIVYDGTGTTCHLKNFDTKLQLVMAAISMIVLIFNSIIWWLFMHKLKKLMHNANDNNQNSDLIVFMKE
eukprot:295055_1